MRIAIIGGGVSGCVAARLLATQHEVTLFEAASHIGGHAQTVNVKLDGHSFPVDVAFMVFNRRTYPNFCRLLEEFDVASQPSDMSFSVRCNETGFEYQGGTLAGLFAQRANLFRPSYWQMLRDILRFNRLAIQAATADKFDESQTVGDFLNKCEVGPRFVDHYLVPMAAAIWSSRPRDVLDYPARFLIGFFANHGLLQIRDRPQWRTIVGGSRNYVEPMLADMADQVRTNEPVSRVHRNNIGVEVALRSGDIETFDEVVFATHADQTLQILSDASPDESSILSAFPYQPNHAVLHTDTRLLPNRRAAWASWNYRLSGDSNDRNATVTYDLSRLQKLPTSKPLLLTLNETESIDRTKVIREFSFAHPAYSKDSMAIQQRWGEVSGRNRVHFCGAYWSYGFHEDGVKSALAVANHFGIGIESCRAACIKAPSLTTVVNR